MSSSEPIAYSGELERIMSSEYDPCDCGHDNDSHNVAGNESWLCGICSCAPFTLTDAETIARVLRP